MRFYLQNYKVKKLEAAGRITTSLDIIKGEIKIRGFKHHIAEAFDAVHHIIRGAEMAQQSKQKAKVFTENVQWYYMEDEKGKKTLVEYPSDINMILEIALKEQKTQTSFFDAHAIRYDVDLNAYEENPSDNPSDKVQVLRKFKLVGK